MRQLRDEEDPKIEGMRKRGREVAEALQGTARDLKDESTEEERNNSDFLDELDTLVFECDTCNWWCELSEHNTCGNCNDCCDHAQNDDMECIEEDDA